MLLAGDLGGTKTLLGLFRGSTPRPAPVEVREFSTLQFQSLEAMVDQFLADTGTAESAIEAASIGVAGPIVDQTADLTNVPWQVDGAHLRGRLAGARVWLLNDVEAMGYAVDTLADDERVVLQTGEAAPDGNAVLVTVGTGLGVGFLPRVGGRVAPQPSEGGHADFAPRTRREMALTQYVIDRFGRADVERIASGLGLVNVAAFTHGGRCGEWPADADDAAVPALVSATALAGRCARCREALDLFIEAVGSVIGNVAILGVARAGVFVGGGIPPKLLPEFQTARFLDAFRRKPPMETLLSRMPVVVITNPRTGLIGAAVHAAGVEDDG
jgi:glucokinase